MADVAAKIGAHMTLVSAALVTPQNGWHPVRILLNTAIRYNMMNEKVMSTLIYHSSQSCLFSFPAMSFFSGDVRLRFK